MDLFGSGSGGSGGDAGGGGGSDSDAGSGHDGDHGEHHHPGYDIKDMMYCNVATVIYFLPCIAQQSTLSSEHSQETHHLFITLIPLMWRRSIIISIFTSKRFYRLLNGGHGDENIVLHYTVTRYRPNSDAIVFPKLNRINQLRFGRLT